MTLKKPTVDYKEMLKRYKKDKAQKAKQGGNQMKFNSKQKTILIIGIVIILLMGAILPWNYTYKSSSTYREIPAGYYFIFISPPTRRAHGIKIDISRLAIQWIITIAATTAGVMLTAKKD